MDLYINSSSPEISMMTDVIMFKSKVTFQYNELKYNFKNYF